MAARYSDLSISEIIFLVNNPNPSKPVTQHQITTALNRLWIIKGGCGMKEGSEASDRAYEIDTDALIPPFEWLVKEH